MRLTLADWVVVALYFLFNVAVGLYYKSRASQNTAEFFLSGRSVPWWLAGTSMVATTFAADTPLVVTGLVAQNGIAGNWLWWNLLASGMLTDRKSTRLNSSHGYISYAVFCLKKKKQNRYVHHVPCERTVHKCERASLSAVLA